MEEGKTKMRENRTRKSGTCDDRKRGERDGGKERWMAKWTRREREGERRGRGVTRWKNLPYEYTDIY